MCLYTPTLYLTRIYVLLYLTQALKNDGAVKISLFVTHAVFPQESWRKFTDGLEFENFWITDSIPHALEIVKNPPFKLISLCDVIADSLLGYDLVSNRQ